MTYPHDSASSAPPKADPESLALRAPPRPVVRFRRGLLIGAAALASTLLVAVAWVALQPAGLRFASQTEELYRRDRTAPPESVAGLPGSDGEVPPGVPKLGPPLPGDLGRPILEQQRESETMTRAPGDLRLEAPQLERQRLEAERQRLEAETRAARAAGVLAPLSGRREGTGSAKLDESAAPADSKGEALAAPRPRILASEQQRSGASRHRLQPAGSPWQVDAGSVIAASLVTGLNSDLPGLVVAQVTHNVFDSATGQTVLIPQGSRLIGSYDNVVAFGQRRALLVWQRLILPDGSSLQLDNEPASDSAGYAGLEDKVDFHSWRLLKGIALSTLFGVGAELSLGSSESDLVRALRESAQRSGSEAGGQFVSKNLAVQPTITVRPGWPLRVVLHKDLMLRPWVIGHAEYP